LVPSVIGVIALLVGAYFLYVTLREPASPQDSRAAAQVHTTRMVSHKGGFSIGVPAGLTASRHGRFVRLKSNDSSLVVTAGPARGGSLKQGSRQFVHTMKAGYRRVRVLGRQPQKIDGRKALATYGRAVNGKSVRIRFVSVLVHARPHNYTITMFTGFGTDPAVVLPKVNAIANTFKVRPKKH
jgi:hypothetical protein